MNLLRLRVEGRHGGNGADQNTHRVGVVAEGLDELDQAVVQEEVALDPVLPPVEALLRGQLAVEEQVGNLQVGALLRQLLDRVATILENAFVAINEGDRTLTLGRIHVGRIV